MKSKSVTTPPLVLATSAQPWKPHAYQRKAVKFLLERAGAGLFLDPGLGKTSITLCALNLLKKAKQSRVSLVVAPLRVCASVWEQEAKKWTDFKHMSIKVLHGSRKEDVLASATDGDVLCINPEGLRWLLGMETVKSRTGKKKAVLDKARLKWLFDTIGITDLIVDESTRFKNSASLVFKTIKQVLHRFRRRWILTGTPTPNGLMDLFSQMFIVDTGRSLGQYITHYRRTYFTPIPGTFDYYVTPGMEQAIYDRIKPLVLRLAAEDYLDLPELVENVIRFDLPAAARTLYDQLEDDLVGDLEDGIVTAANAAVATGKCAQVANGGLYKQRDPLLGGRRGKASEWVQVHTEKDDIVAQLMEDIGNKPTLIAYEYDHDLQRLRALFGKDTPCIGGGVSVKEGKRLEAEWNAGRLPILLVQPDSVKFGLNLQGAGASAIGHIIFYALVWNYEAYDQLIKRILRQGSKHKRVCAHLLVARATVDEAKLGSLRRKRKGMGGLFDALRTYVADRAVSRGAGKGGRGKVLQNSLRRTGARAKLRSA